MPGLAEAADLSGNYPLQYRRSGSRLTLEGAADRVIRFDGTRAPDRLRIFVVGEPLAPPTVAAGFSWQAAPAFGLHVCGPEVTVSLTLP